MGTHNHTKAPHLRTHSITHSQNHKHIIGAHDNFTTSLTVPPKHTSFAGLTSVCFLFGLLRMTLATMQNHSVTITGSISGSEQTLHLLTWGERQAWRLLGTVVQQSPRNTVDGVGFEPGQRKQRTAPRSLLVPLVLPRLWLLLGVARMLELNL